ncbi:putative ribonuclease H-like domain-containing protein [Tanacetum coccineum]
MAHVNFKTINKLAKEGLVDGLPLKVFTNEHNCVACNKGKQHKASYKHISAVRLITEPLQLLHMDLFGPTNIRSIDQKYYSLVVTDDFSRFTWSFYLGTKDETFYVLKEFIALIENQLNKKVKGIRCDNGTEFKNAKLIELCGEKGIKRDYSNPRTPQQNGVAERKNRTLIEAARTMLADSKLPTMFWTEAVSTACYVLNRVSITNPHNKTPYELISGKVPQIGHLKPFGCQVTILNTSDHLGKFEGKADEGYLVGYAPNSKAYRVYNLTNKRVEETMNLRFLEDKPNVQGIGHEWYFDLDYLTDSLGYTRFKTDKPAGTQETNINAGTQDHDSESEVDEQVIVVPSFPSNTFAGPSSSNGPSVMERNADYAEELAKLQRQEYEAKDAAARYGYLFSQATAEILSQAEAEIRNQGVSADRDPAGIDSADSDSAGGNPAGSFQPAASYEPAGQGNPAVSTSVSADFSPVHADESTLPPGQSLGSSENNTRFPVPSDVCKDQLSSGIFTSSSYDDDFSATLTNLAPAVEVNPVPTKRVNTIHPQSQILGDLASPVLTRSRAQKSKFGESAFIGYIQDQQRINHTDQLHCLFACFLSQLEPTSIAKALEDPDWVAAMQEEMQQFINQKVWKLVPLPHGKHAIGTKWILKNKRDARGIVVRNKARLVAQGHRQEEGIDYDEVFAPVARIEAIRLFLAFASYMGFLVYQMDVKSAFLYGEIEEEVYVTQPKGFEDPYFPKHVYKSGLKLCMYFIKHLEACSRPDIKFAVSACSNIKLLHDFSSECIGSHSDSELCWFFMVIEIHYQVDVNSGRRLTHGSARIVNTAAGIILPAASLVSAGSSMFLLVFLAGCTMVLLEVIVPAGFFVPAGSYGLCAVQLVSAIVSNPDGGTMYALPERYKDDHNRIAYLGRERGSEDFTDILSYLDHSPLRYALTHDPPVVFDSLVKQLWATATVPQMLLGPHDLVEAIDAVRWVVTESPSLGSQLQNDDANGIFDMQIDEFLRYGLMGIQPGEHLLFLSTISLLMEISGGIPFCIF